MPRLALLLLALAAPLAAVPALADVVPGLPSAETEIAGLLGRWDRARAQRDAPALAEIMAEDFAASWAEGGRLGRADILAGRAPEAGARLIYREDIAVTVAGENAVFTSRVIRIGTTLGPERAEISRETVTLRRERDRWRLVSSRSRPARAVP